MLQLRLKTPSKPNFLNISSEVLRIFTNDRNINLVQLQCDRSDRVIRLHESIQHREKRMERLQLLTSTSRLLSSAYKTDCKARILPFHSLKSREAWTRSCPPCFSPSSQYPLSLNSAARWIWRRSSDRFAASACAAITPVNVSNTRFERIAK